MRPLILITTASCVFSVGAAAQTSLHDLSFMTGCWQGPADGAGMVIEERYTAPSDNVMLGTTRYLKDGGTVQFEFTLLRDEDGIAMFPYPGGRQSDIAFRLTHVAAAADGTVRAMFEAPEHDFPKRIMYTGNTVYLEANIDGGEGTNSKRWRMTRTACELAR